MPEITTLGRDIAEAIAPFQEPQNSVRSRVVVTPPPSAAIGDRYIVPAGGDGAWSGHGNAITHLTATGWVFLVPTEGMTLWIDDEDLPVAFDGLSWVSTGGGSPGEPGAVGVPTRANKRMSARATTADGQLAVSIGIARTPAAGGYVGVRLDGLDIPYVGDGTKVGAWCYFSGDAGVTARAWSAITLGDTLHWQGTVAGFELATTDVFDFDYEEAS